MNHKTIFRPEKISQFHHLVIKEIKDNQCNKKELHKMKIAFIAPNRVTLISTATKEYRSNILGND